MSRAEHDRKGAGMHAIEDAVRHQVDRADAVLRPLERAQGTAPMLTAGVVAAVAGAAAGAFVAGNVVTDHVGKQTMPSSGAGGSTAMSAEDLLATRTAAESR